MEHRCSGTDQARSRHRSRAATARRVWCQWIPAFRQGKWYPGEQLPRWALSVYWRTDGEPCWQDPQLFADEREPVRYTTADARRFMTRLVERLGLDTKYVVPAFEDVFYYLWRERRLPVNVDPFDSRL